MKGMIMWRNCKCMHIFIHILCKNRPFFPLHILCSAALVLFWCLFHGKLVILYGHLFVHPPCFLCSLFSVLVCRVCSSKGKKGKMDIIWFQQTILKSHCSQIELKASHHCTVVRFNVEAKHVQPQVFTMHNAVGGRVLKSGTNQHVAASGWTS